MKSNKVLEEVNYMLLPETAKDKQLNPIDLNTLVICQYVANFKQLEYNKDGWFILPLRKNDKIKTTSIEEYLSNWGVKVSADTIERAINKLKYLGYIDYKRGRYYNLKKSGQLPEIKILKGTIPNLQQPEEELTINDTESYSGIAVTTYTYTESEKETNNNTNSSSTSIESESDTVEQRETGELESLYKQPQNLSEFWECWNNTTKAWRVVPVEELKKLWMHYDNKLKELLPTDEGSQRNILWSDLNKEYTRRENNKLQVRV